MGLLWIQRDLSFPPNSQTFGCQLPKNEETKVPYKIWHFAHSVAADVEVSNWSVENVLWKIRAPRNINKKKKWRPDHLLFERSR